MTVVEAARAAIDVQDASNLSGVLRSFADAVSAVRELPGVWNAHPVVVLFASKVGSLAGIGGGDLDAFGDAFFECQQLVERGDA